MLTKNQFSKSISGQSGGRAELGAALIGDVITAPLQVPIVAARRISENASEEDKRKRAKKAYEKLRAEQGDAHQPATRREE